MLDILLQTSFGLAYLRVCFFSLVVYQRLQVMRTNCINHDVVTTFGVHGLFELSGFLVTEL